MMRFVAESGLWTTGPVPEPVPLTAVLEVRGAVLAWTVDESAGHVHIAFTDVTQADWLWRVLGEDGHSSLASALETGVPAGELELAGVEVAPGSLDSLRRLALGHWLRRWWPASRRDGIAELDSALLDGEMALLTAAAEDFFGDESTFDSDVEELLSPYTGALNSLAQHSDPRVVEIVRACLELAGDTGMQVGDVVPAASSGRREDYALAAGATGPGGAGQAVVTGVGSVNWSAVPQGIFDAAEDTVDWRIDADGASVSAVVQAEVSGPGSPAGIAVRISSRGFDGAGALDASGAATLPLFDEDRRPASDTAAWNHDWRDTQVSVGVPVDESRHMRDRARAFARARLSRPGADAFLAEILAAESDY